MLTLTKRQRKFLIECDTSMGLATSGLAASTRIMAFRMQRDGLVKEILRDGTWYWRLTDLGRAYVDCPQRFRNVIECKI